MCEVHVHHWHSKILHEISAKGSGLRGSITLLHIYVFMSTIKILSMYTICTYFIILNGMEKQIDFHVEFSVQSHNWMYTILFR